jgi:ribosomal protein S18 acetylase RimI-like enzyme
MELDSQDTYTLEPLKQTLPEDFKVHPATSFSLEAIAGLFTLGFEGSLVPVRMSAGALSLMIRRDSLDLAASRVFTKGDRPVAFILMCSRGWSRRVAGMGVVSDFRRIGLGHRLMETVIQDAAENRFRRILLEVVEGNDSAVRLYRELGFQVERRLVGYQMRCRNDLELTGDELREMDPRELGKILEYEAPPDTPWQLSMESIAAAGPPEVALRLGDKAYVLINGLTETDGTLHLVLVPHALRRQGWGMRLIRALCGRYPGRRWRIPARFPENLAPEFFERAGFRRLAPSQLEMVLTVR